ncbi:MAG: GumC family protein [Rhodothermales bacterium]
MDANSSDNPTPEALHRYDQERKARAREIFFLLARTVYKRRGLIVIVTGIVAVLSVVISLLLPKWYTSSTRLLSPESGGASPISAAMLKNLSSAASSFLGIGGGGDYERYISIMTSRTVYEEVVNKFDLITVYEATDSEDPMGSAVETIADNTEFSIDLEFGYLTINVTDQDPKRAAEMANFFVSELNRVNMALSSQDAGHYRRFVEQRYSEVLAELDSLKKRTQAFQEEHGVFDIQTQAVGFFEQLAAMRAEEIALEIEYQVLLSQYGKDNLRVASARLAFLAAKEKTQGALEGQERILPVAQEEVPAIMRQFLQLEQEGLIQKSLLEVIAPLYDQARFQEERTFQAVQVIDKAIPPFKKSKPKRSIIVIVATMTGFILVLLYVLARAWWQANYPIMQKHLHTITEGARTSEDR